MPTTALPYTAIVAQFGSDVTGDVYYRSAAGILARLGIGTAGQVIGISGGLPAWVTVAGSGDMILAAIQSVTGLKTFDTSRLAVKGSGSGVTAIASANASVTDYVATLKAATGTIAYIADITGTNSGTNTGDQFVFGTIAIAGESNVVADQAGDTLTLVAGSNITLTTNAATDTITISSAGGGVSDGDKGDITVSSSGAVWTIDAATITLAKMANVATSTVFYRKTSATGVPEVQTLATLKTDLGLTGTNSGDQDLSTYATTSAVAAAYQPLDSDLTVIASLTATSDNFLQSKAGAWASRTIAQVKTDLGLTGTNSGDQTSIVGITGTKAQFDTAVTDGNILYVGDAPTAHNHVGSEITSGTVDPVRLGSGASITTKFLRGDSTWQTISGGGDALTASNLSQFAATTSLQLLGVMSDETGTGALVFATSPTFVTPILGTPTSGVATNLTGTAAGLTAGSVTTNANLTGHVTSTGNAAVLGAFTKAQLDTAVSDGNVLYVGDVTTNATHTGDATGSGALTVVRLNGTSLAGLATGLLRNTTSTGVPSIAVNSDLPAMSATVGGAVPTPPNNTTTFLRGDGTFATPAGSGDMVLANTQTVTGAKTFNNTRLFLRNVADTFSGSFVNTNTADRVYTLKDAAGTLAFTTDITGTNSGTNTGDNAVNSQYSGLISNATHTGDVTGATALTISAGVVTNAMLAGSIDLTTKVTGSLPVANGGTGRATSTTAFALIAAGTTATGVHQSLAAGATTEILVGGGASALPVWTTATGSGTPVRATSPSLVTPLLGTPTSGNLANCTFPTLNQSTSGSAATLTTPRTIGGVAFDGSAAIVPQTIQSVNEAADTTCFLLFISASGSQSLQPLNNTALTFNSSTSELGATSLATSQITLSGNISSAAWTTSGVRIKGVSATFTDTTSSGTVATAYTNVYGGNTIAASAATTFTNYVTAYFQEPVAGTNVTLTNRWAIGADSLRVGTSNQFTVTLAGVATFAAAVSITKSVYHTNTTGTPSGTTQTIDWTQGNWQTLDLGSASGAVTLTFTAPTGPANLTLKLVQGATARNITWPASVKWDSIGAPIWGSDTSKTRIISFAWDGTNYFGLPSDTFT